MADELSLRELERERSELQKDWIAFSRSYDLLKSRILESTEMDPPRAPMLHTWSGTRAVCGSLEMAIHSIQRTIEEYGELIQKVKSGEIRNSDRPTLSLLKESVNE